MAELDRRGAVLALLGTVASGVAAGAWLFRGAEPLSRPDRRIGTGGALAGAVTVLGSRREPRASAGGHGHHAAASGATGHGGWSQAVVADVEVHNPGRRPIVVSPGQFRLRLGEQGPTVSFYDAERRIGVLPAGHRVRLWIRYLTPPDPVALALEYTGPGAAPQSFALSPAQVPA